MTDSFNDLRKLPPEISEIKGFLTWKLTYKSGQKKPAKIPYYANGNLRAGDQGSPEDIASLVTLNEALAAAERDGSSGVGLAMLESYGLTALDFDNCVVDRKVINEEIANLCWGTYTEISPSGTGLRAFFKGYLPSRKDTKGEPFAVEVFGGNGYVTVTGDVADDCKQFGFESTVAELTPEVMQMYRDHFGEPISTSLSTIDESDSFMLSLKPTHSWTLDQGRDILMACDASCGRDEWVKAGMAMHFEFNGSAEAMGLYNEWSSKGGNYGGLKDVEGRWRSFGKGRASTITGSWLISWSKSFEPRRVFNNMEQWKTQIKSVGDEFQLRSVICPKIVADELVGAVERECLAQELVAAFKSLGTKYPIAMCRKMLLESKTSNLPSVYDTERDEQHYDDTACPDWLKGYVYVTSDDQFFKMNTDDHLSIQGFNAKYNRMMPRNEDGQASINAHTMALEHYKIPVVTRGVYMPMCGPLVHDMGGKKKGTLNVNTYNADSVPLADAELSERGNKAVAWFVRHVHMYCGKRQHVTNAVLSWLAFNVQNPGVKIRWAILIKGIEGDGKSLIGELMRAVMGRANVKSVSPTVLTSDFNGYAEGACLAILEELRISGSSKFDTQDKLKPLITNDTVLIHRKGKDSYECWNTQNYLGNTNYDDSLPLNNNDRRYMVIFSPFMKIDQLNAELEQYGGASAYFTELNELCQSEFRAIRRFMLDYEIDEAFEPNGRAPETDEKQKMIALSVSDEQQLVEECIEAGGIGIGKDVLVSSYLRTSLLLADSESQINKHQFNRVMQNLGWSKVTKRVKWNGKTEIVWFSGKNDVWNLQMKKSLDETLPGGSVLVPEFDDFDRFM
jgi:hypothetical protein